MREGYKETAIGWIPTDWRYTKLGSEVELIHGFQFRSEDFVEKGIPVIKIGNVIGSQLELKDLSFIDPRRLRDFKQFEILDGDILMSLTGNIGRVIEVSNLPFQVVQNYRVGKFVSKSDLRLLKKYIKHLLSSNLVLDQLNKFANQSAQANFGKQDMDKIWIALPDSLVEQSKIASILSTVDDKIDAINERIIQTQQLKNGLMQRLLTKGIGHTKFIDSPLGRIPESWAVGTLENISVIIMGQSPSGDTYNTQKIGTPILNGPTEFTKTHPLPVQYTTQETKLSKKGDILFCVRGSSTGRMNISDREYCIGRGLAAIRSRSNSNTQFIYFILSALAKEILRKAKDMGSTFPNVNSVELKRTAIAIPPVNEQSQIAEILSTVDSKLESMHQRKNEYEKLKKGLIQKLLTGQIRVNTIN